MKAAILTEQQQYTKIMFHGTSDVNLRSILKNGLMHQPPAATFGGRDEDEFNQELSMKTFGGVYITPVRVYALTIADDATMVFGGNRILITIQYVHGSGDVDEDPVIDSFERAIIDFYHDFASRYSDTTDHEDLMDAMDDEMKYQFIKKVSETMVSDLGNIGRLGKVVPSAVIQLLTLFANFYHEGGWVNFAAQEELDFSNLFVSPRPFMRPIPEFVKYIEIIMNNLYPSRVDKHHPIRLTRDIKFKGKTRIIKIQAIEGDKRVYYADQNYYNIMAGK